MHANPYNIGAVIAALLLIWVVLLAISARGYRGIRRRRSRADVHYEFHGTDDAHELERVVDARRRRVEGLLREYGELGPPFEFVENPPGCPSAEAAQFEEDVIERAVQASRLRWQLSDPVHLLGERLVDLLLACTRAGQFRSRDWPTEIRSEEHALGASRRSHFELVVETPRPLPLMELLMEHGRWLALSISIVASRFPVVHFSNCATGWPPGVVGGLVQADNDAQAGITCMHVVCPACGYRRWPRRPELGPAPIDMALVDTSAPCFRIQRFVPTVVAPASAQDIHQLMKARATVVKAHQPSRPQGRVESHVFGTYAVRYGNRLARGPHITIEPKFWKLLGVTWPLWGRHFSASGDSGAWVIDARQKKWIGMIVAGSCSPNTVSYALPAWHLLDVLRILPGFAAPELYALVRRP